MGQLGSLSAQSLAQVHIDLGRGSTGKTWEGGTGFAFADTIKRSPPPGPEDVPSNAFIQYCLRAHKEQHFSLHHV